MKVAIICDVLGVPNNGTSIATLNLISYLKKAGHDIKVVSSDFEHSGVALENQVQLPSLDLGVFANRIIANNGVSLAKADNSILKDVIVWADVVHIQLPLIIGRVAVRIARQENKPITASFHCQAENVLSHVHLEHNMWISKQVYKNFYSSLFQYCDCIHYPTDFIRFLFERSVGHKTCSYVISNGVNSLYVNRHLPRTNEKFTIVSTGRFCAEKAQHILIKAASISKYRDSIKLRFAGEGPLLEKYIYLANKLKVDADFNFYSRNSLVDVLNTANLYVHTAFIEIEAISCIEAICCGLVPVIARAKRSATKVFALDKNNLFKENDADDLAKRIDFWYENPAIREEYVKRYEVMAHQFEQEECMRRMESMLQDAIALKKTVSGTK